MARPKRICSIDNCGKPAHGRGWCSDHYARWSRHGDPLAGRTVPGELERYFQEVVLPYKGDDCLIWPYSRSCGYGYVSTGGGRYRVHRLACEILQGPPPTPDHVAAHSCGNGHLGCVNPNHVRWATNVENMADAIEHGTTTAGTRHALAKLNDEQINTILSLKGDVTQRDLAARFGVTQSQISHIHTGKRWGRNNGIQR